MTQAIGALLITFLLVHPAPGQIRSTEPEATEVSADSYGVYAALFRHKPYNSWVRAPHPLRISALTSGMPPGIRTEDCRFHVAHDDADVQLLNTFMAANATRHRIGQKLSVPGEYLLIRKKTTVKNGDQPGIVWLSAVAFSPDRQRAMVYITNYCGPLCGSGSLWKLVKENTVWRATTETAICGFIS